MCGCLPWSCRSHVFWISSILPIPILNGALLRFYINKFLSVEERRSIVRFVEIQPDCEQINHIKPPSDSSRGFQQIMTIIGVRVENRLRRRPILTIMVILMSHILHRLTILCRS